MRKLSGKKKIVSCVIIIFIILLVLIINLTYEQDMFDDLTQRNFKNSIVFSDYIKAAVENKNNNIDFSYIWCENLSIKYLKTDGSDDYRWHMSWIYAYPNVENNMSEFIFEKATIIGDVDVNYQYIKNDNLHYNMFSIAALENVLRKLDNINYLDVLGFVNYEEEQNIHLDFEKRIYLEKALLEEIMNSEQVYLLYDEFLVPIKNIDADELESILNQEYIVMSISDGTMYYKVFCISESSQESYL